MYDDYEFEYEYNNESYTYDLAEMCEYHMARSQTSMRDMHETYHNDDDEYARDSCDYDTLAYRHYACLLYTSPSPRDVEESRMPSSA